MLFPFLCFYSVLFGYLIRRYHVNGQIFNEYKMYIVTVSLYIIIILDKVSLYRPGWCGSHYIDESGLQLIDIWLLLPPS